MPSSKQGDLLATQRFFDLVLEFAEGQGTLDQFAID